MKGIIISLGTLAASVIAQKCPANGIATSAVTADASPKPQNVPQGCAGFEILVARGTGEPDRNATADSPAGKFGIVVGDPLVDNVVKAVPNARGYPVQYPANMIPNTVGQTDVVNRLKKMDKECPDMKFALVGYSQGAMVMHQADPNIPADIRKKIVAAAMFGDPVHQAGPGYISGVQSVNVCNYGNDTMLPDPVCYKSPKEFCFDAHVHYWEPKFMFQAIEFFVQAFRGQKLESKVIKGNESFTPDPKLQKPLKFISFTA